MSKGHNARYAKLQVDYTDLMNLANRSDFIKIEPVDVEPGWPPERYLITFTCAGIFAIQSDGTPIVSVHHEVEMYLSADYPLKIPSLLWRTGIWHPNIAHVEPRHVCTDDVKTHFASKPLSELVLFMAELVQYRRYHATSDPPFPLDKEAARWVLDVAEPRGWIAHDRPFDGRPLLREHRIVKASPEAVAEANSWSFRAFLGETVPAAMPPIPVVQSGSPPAAKKGMGIQLGNPKAQEAVVDLPAKPDPTQRRTGRISLGQPKLD